MATVVAVFRLPPGATSTAADGAVIAASVITGGISDRVLIAVVLPAPKPATDDDLHGDRRGRSSVTSGSGREQLTGSGPSVIAVDAGTGRAGTGPARRAGTSTPGRLGQGWDVVGAGRGQAGPERVQPHAYAAGVRGDARVVVALRPEIGQLGAGDPAGYTGAHELAVRRRRGLLSAPSVGCERGERARTSEARAGGKPRRRPGR